ncbi:MAG TPA: SUMF1/EgtB/PvdO family nonheme iron enzyme [Myxococcota bacterium]|nr:SUMF1/EgtB/PvdO family nonheme iron enzyme [Myxococcota bacterium]HRY97296.1 SUMF1/EgtB/PvdO family nonheme iron enzyme [Myxococcota bacterium]HSA23884.1 SUMF1/EgtB/PvdO family nonheme iron enzyme [Myxococcota bacterium]
MKRLCLSTLWLLCLGWLGLTGCDTKSRPGLVCDTDGDCPAGSICLAEHCEAYQCVSSGDCPSGQECIDHRCAVPMACDDDGDCVEPTPVCDTGIGRCVGCLPDCAGRECGGDGCLGSCGQCPAGEECSALGRCETCAPDCAGKDCGDDGCGGSCGQCGTGEVCDQAGGCVACTPECGVRECGPDPVCGASCGICEAGCTCTADGVCAGNCQCTPDCSGKDCGPDGCQGSCGTCATGEVCDQAGQCTPVGCGSDGDCQAPLPRCEPTSGTCVACLAAEDCQGGQICSGFVCADPPRCQSDGECEIGQICVQGACLVGCRSNRDCPDGQTCDTDLGPDGTCIECAVPGDCPAGQTCQDHLCVPYCTAEAHCAPLHCNLTSHQCVACTADEHCADGSICQADACVAGCRADEDCDTGHCLVAESTCVDCLSLDHCPLGTLCVDHACVMGCRDSRDCPAGLLCDTDLGAQGTCVECLGDEDCLATERCAAGLCQFFCDADADCSPPNPACDPAQGVCVQCTRSDHCPAGTICLEQACTPGCTADRDCPEGMVCEPDLGPHGSCVECLEDADCGVGFACDQNRCVIAGSEMVRLPGTSFNRGSPAGVGESDETPMKQVVVPTYYLDRTEVTNAQYQACVQAGWCSLPSDTTAYGDPARADHPVVYVSWQQASDFCGWVGKSLPSEARWERAARGDALADRTYPWGDGAPDCARANYSGCQAGGNATAEVGSRPGGATPEGALDLAGNVWEWCYDYYSSTYYGEQDALLTDPYGPAEGTNRVVRGGAFNSLPEALRTANRASRDPASGHLDVGFRCAMRGVPVAEFSVSPASGDYAFTTFAVDASLTTDPNQPLDLLEVQWDWEDDGVYDTPWSQAKTASHRFVYGGIFRIRLEVSDPDGNTDDVSHKVIAEGAAGGWDGDTCATTQDCAHGFTCAFSWADFAYHCREDCLLLLEPECVLPDRTCNLVIDLVGGTVGSACLPP